MAPQRRVECTRCWRCSMKVKTWAWWWFCPGRRFLWPPWSPSLKHSCWRSGPTTSRGRRWRSTCPGETQCFHLDSIHVKPVYYILIVRIYLGSRWNKRLIWETLCSSWASRTSSLKMPICQPWQPRWQVIDKHRHWPEGTIRYSAHAHRCSGCDWQIKHSACTSTTHISHLHILYINNNTRCFCVACGENDSCFVFLESKKKYITVNFEDLCGNLIPFPVLFLFFLFVHFKISIF